MGLALLFREFETNLKKERLFIFLYLIRIKTTKIRDLPKRDRSGIS